MKSPALGALRIAWLIGLVALASNVGAAQQDPFEGKWLGQIGSPKERIEVGLEFKRLPDGQLGLLLTQPISNQFGADVGAVQRDGDTVRSEALFLELTLKDGALTGHFPGPKSPAVLKRVDALPAEPPIPAVPTGPEPRWQVRLGGQIFASPVVADGVVFIGTSGGVFNAVNARDGSFAWTFAAGCAIYGAAAVDDAVYFGCDDGHLYKLDRKTGKQQWRYRLSDAVSRVLPHPQVFAWEWQAPEPVVADGVVYLGAADGGFHAVDANTGARRWRFDTGAAIHNGAAIDGARVVVGSSDHFVYSLERASGKELWRVDTRAAIDATPVLHDGRVLVGNRGAGLYSLDAATGAEQWRLYFWGSWVESTPVVADGTIYIGSSDLRRVSAIDPANGHVRRRTDVYGWSWGTPLVRGDRLYVGAAGGAPYFIEHKASFSTLDRHSGRLLTRRPLHDTGGHQWGIAGSPVLAGENIVVATIAGALHGFSPE